jgi:hypothetical protein
MLEVWIWLLRIFIKNISKLSSKLLKQLFLLLFYSSLQTLTPILLLWQSNLIFRYLLTLRSEKKNR